MTYVKGALFLSFWGTVHAVLWPAQLYALGLWIFWQLLVWVHE